MDVPGNYGLYLFMVMVRGKASLCQGLCKLVQDGEKKLPVEGQTYTGLAGSGRGDNASDSYGWMNSVSVVTASQMHAACHFWGEPPSLTSAKVFSFPPGLSLSVLPWCCMGKMLPCLKAG